MSMDIWITNKKEWLKENDKYEGEKLEEIRKLKILKEEKPFLNINEQKKHIESYGLDIAENDLLILKKINYYRLKPFIKKMSKSSFTEKNFKNIIDMYKLDKRLRNNIILITERIEVIIKSKLIKMFNTQYPKSFYFNREHFIKDKNSNKINKMFKKIKKSIEKKEKQSHSPVSRYNKKYGCSLDFDNFGDNKGTLTGTYPIWLVVETITFSQTTWIISNLKKEDKEELFKDIGGSKNFFYENIKDYSNALNGIKEIRNICCHNEILYKNKIRSFLPAYPEMTSLSSKENDYYKSLKGLFRYLQACRVFIDDDMLWKNLINTIEEILEHPLMNPYDYELVYSWKDILLLKKN